MKFLKLMHDYVFWKMQDDFICTFCVFIVYPNNKKDTSFSHKAFHVLTAAKEGSELNIH